MATEGSHSPRLPAASEAQSPLTARHRLLLRWLLRRLEENQDALGAAAEERPLLRAELWRRARRALWMDDASVFRRPEGFEDRFKVQEEGRDVDVWPRGR